MSGHVFISYSHAADSDYVAKLAAHLTAAGVVVWFDQKVVTGDRWSRVIQQQIDTCAAFIVVMSPASNKSDWVDREIDQAQLRGKPVFPLLLGGERFFRLAHLQFVDVTGDRMPPAGFVAQLHSAQTAAPAAFAAPVVVTVDAAILERQHTDAVTMYERGDYAEAADLLRHVIADRTRVQGADHPDTLNSRHDLANSIGESGDRAEAVRLYRTLVADRIRVLGVDHPDTLDSRHNLAYNIGEGGDRAEAVRLFRTLVADHIRVLGVDDPETLTARHNLAYNIGEIGNRAEAVRLLRTLVADRNRILGADHLHTLSTRHNLAYNIGQGGDRAEAVRLLRQVVADHVRVLGADHPETEISRQALKNFGG
ncbi:tetratricopeptide repeat protein [Catellatospora tritici]|uniref:tetratricopeptide repeat protein n=1 Tax=Catellatospora tritici TaxID=2851566 RepID=UPI001C2D3914|nr:toll/interleukin-1 receptor domain-containing protein [Catellatospora tritici]MBV1855885.1 toll/interleukin-1 receptor domain-containing protein [Catellatospora tritici]